MRCDSECARSEGSAAAVCRRKQSAGQSSVQRASVHSGRRSERVTGGAQRDAIALPQRVRFASLRGSHLPGCCSLSSPPFADLLCDATAAPSDPGDRIA